MNALVLCTLALATLAAARPQQFTNQFNPQQQQKFAYQQQYDNNQVVQQAVQQVVQQPYQQQYAQPAAQPAYQQQQYNYNQYAYRQEDAAAASSTTPIPILSYVNEINPDGSYHYSYETGNGIKADESGKVNNAGLENEAIAVQGSYSYIGDDGQTYSVQYTADENGFQPQGAHLPTAPPLPAELQKAIDEHLAILATAKPAEEEASSVPDQRFLVQRHF
ncbi:larval cuticle protein LCP-22-like [Frankliniella occidentalis]|uniref:Larval cuticle protein LCP-22-like n=1 Tax=Frankliniella occidentalis TaxID=133901 RepID=A0A9C6X0P6_FRAOC|nr:larval cuticle protein LCP-22-like [Frankliniella occidentalis]